jgi:hypothetical protein
MNRKYILSVILCTFLGFVTNISYGCDTFLIQFQYEFYHPIVGDITGMELYVTYGPPTEVAESWYSYSPDLYYDEICGYETYANDSNVGSDSIGEYTMYACAQSDEGTWAFASVPVYSVGLGAISGDSEVPVGVDSEYSASVLPSGYGLEYYVNITWSGGGVPSGVTNGAGWLPFTTKWNSAGQKQLQASVGSSASYKYVTVTNPLPTPGIIEDDWYQYAPVGQTVKVDGYDSYDNDENGYRIDVWEWGVYKWNGSEYIYQSYSDTFTSDEYFTFYEPGKYLIKLWVRDDDDGWNGWSSSYDYCYIAVVSVDEIAIGYSPLHWDNVAGDTITLLKGTKYTFLAIPNPYGVSWPSNQPTWSGCASGTGDSKEVSFNYCVGTYLTVKCGSYDDGKTVYINVVAPEPNQITFLPVTTGDQHPIYGITMNDPIWKQVSNPDYPACYTKGKPMRVKAKFWASDSLTYATPVIVGISSSWGFADYNLTSFSCWPSDSTFHNSSNNLNNWVGHANISLTWQYKVPGGASPDTWITMVDDSNNPIITTHKIYKLLGAPTAPMATPWRDVLEIACNAANGASVTTESDVMYKIWYEFYYSSGGVYDTNDGSPSYAYNPPDYNFNLTNFISNYGSIGSVNCYDMGQSLVIFANALGCNSVYTYIDPFGYLNCIHPIGCGWTNNPFYSNPDNDPNAIVDGDSADDGISGNHAGRSFFGNHGVARIGNYIFDASVGQVDVNAPIDRPPCTAYSLDGDDTWTSNYRTKVIDNNPSTTGQVLSTPSFGVK